MLGRVLWSDELGEPSIHARVITVLEWEADMTEFLRTGSVRVSLDQGGS